MDAVIKVGGSLASDASILRSLCVELARIANQHRLVVVPGGGELADAVRLLDDRFGLSPRASHRMAVLSMDQYGLLLSELIPSCSVAYSLSLVRGLSSSGRVVVLLPSKLVFRARSLAASWNVTSDSIAAYVAARLGASKLVLVTDVDGVFTRDPKLNVDTELIGEVSASDLLALSSRTSVDKFLPKLVLKFGLNCFVVNGRFPERVAHILADAETVRTRISAK